jgi:hypothetical protein
MDAHWKETIELDAQVDRIYAYLADFPNHCEWAQTLERMELKKAGDNRGVGAVYRAHERQRMQADRAPRGPMPARAMKGTTECEITELSPGKRIAWRAHPVPVGMGTHARLSFDLEPIGDSRTRLTQTIDFHQPDILFTFFARVASRTNPAVLEGRMHAQWRASLANVKAILEEPGGPGPTAVV